MHAHKTVASAFVQAKREFGPALKDKTNPAFRSKYADLGACIDAVEDALLKNGLAVYQETFEDPTGVTVETVFLHESGESMRCGKLHVPAAKQDPQGFGSALTYCRRYSLMTACGIAPEDDDGNQASKPRQEPARQRTGVAQDVLATSPALPKEVTDYLDGLSVDVQDVFKARGAQAAYERIDIEQLDDIQKIYLSTVMPSLVKNQITAYSRELHRKVHA